MKLNSLPVRCLSVLTVAGLALTAAAESKPPKLNISSTPIDREARLTASFAPLVKRVTPSVVNIYSTRKSRAQSFIHPFLDDPMFRRFFGDPGGGERQPRKTQSLGSGVIVTEDGYLLTNNHVVEGADEIKIVMSDGKTEYDARIIGRDPQTDVAVLKVDDAKLKPITLADSDKLEVGDVVLAIGNPFGVGQTVTHGIISALSRGGFGITDYEDFIQTDAAINPGNSGGALVDTEGRLIGIAQSIVSRSGTASGVGFAVPINLARGVLERLVIDGKVTRGFLGVNIQPVTPELAKEFNLPDANGALIGGVQPETPAAEAGLRAGDVVVEVNGKSVSDFRQFRLLISQTAPNTKVTLKVLRDGKPRTLNATLGTLPDEFAASEGSESAPARGAAGALRGLELGNLNTAARKQYDIPAEVRGALIVGVEADSAAAAAGVTEGSVIVEVNRRPVQNAEEARAAARDSRGNKLLLRIWSSDNGVGGTRYLLIEPAQK
jgi:serine protease Do